MRAGSGAFHGWRVVGAAFALAVFGWGLGFYGPPVYLHTVREAKNFPPELVSTAVTAHFVTGALVVANLSALHRGFGIPTVTKAAALCLGLGVLGWALATTPAWLFAATLLSGAGWAGMGGAAVNAIVSPWFVRARPAALSMAYNGASIGGVVFSPLWVAAIAALGFPAAAAAIGLVMLMAIWVLADRLMSRTPEQMGLRPDGDAPGPASSAAPAAMPRAGSLLWRDVTFATLAAGMAIGLFAQIGLIAHLFSLLVPALGAQGAGPGDGTGHRHGACRAHGDRLADARRRRPAARRRRQLRGADRRLRRAAAGRRPQRGGAARRPRGGRVGHAARGVVC